MGLGLGSEVTLDEIMFLQLQQANSTNSDSNNRIVHTLTTQEACLKQARTMCWRQKLKCRKECYDIEDQLNGFKAPTITRTFASASNLVADDGHPYRRVSPTL